MNLVFFFKLTVCEDDPNYADACPRQASIRNYCEDQKEFMMQNCPKSCGFCKEGDYLNYFNKFILEITELIDYRVSVGRTTEIHLGQ